MWFSHSFTTVYKFYYYYCYNYYYYKHWIISCHIYYTCTHLSAFSAKGFDNLHHHPCHLITSFLSSSTKVVQHWFRLWCLLVL